MKVRVNTTNYINSHGRKPRGYGLWWFYSKNTGPGTTQVVGRPDNMQELVWGTATYTQIKNEAITEAKEQGIAEIFLAPERRR